MLLYIPKYVGELTHVSTDWFLLKNNDINDLTDDNCFYKELESNNLDSVIVNITIPNDTVAYMYARRNMNDGTVQEFPVETYLSEDVLLGVTNRVVLNVEDPYFTVITNALKTNGGITLHSGHIRPAGNILKHVVWTISNRHGRVMYHTKETGYELHVDNNELQGYINGENITISCTHISLDNVVSNVETMLIEGYGDKPTLLEHSNHIYPSLPFELNFDTTYTKIAVSVYHKNDNIYSSTTQLDYIPKDTLPFGESFTLNILFANEDGEYIDTSYDISTIPIKELYDIDESFIYNFSFDEVGQDEYTQQYGFIEQLFGGMVVSPVSNNVFRVITMEKYLTGDGVTKDTSVNLPDGVDMEDITRILNFDTRTFGAYKDSTKELIIFKYSTTFGHIDYHTTLVLADAVDMTQSFNNNDVWYLTSTGKVMKVDFETKVSKEVLTLREVEDYSKMKLEFIGGDRIIVTGGMDAIYAISTNNGYITKVKNNPFSADTVIDMLLLINGKVLIVDYSTEKAFTYDFHSDALVEVNWQGKDSLTPHHIVRSRDGSFYFKYLGLDDDEVLLHMK